MSEILEKHLRARLAKKAEALKIARSMLDKILKWALKERQSALEMVERTHFETVKTAAVSDAENWTILVYEIGAVIEKIDEVSNG